jgi:FecR-like protein
MRKASRVLPALFVVAVAVSSMVSVTAQDRERFVISAKAGGINAVTGRTGVHAHGSSEWEQLTIKDNLEAGDVVKTSGDGRVEMLLNPGSYLRVAENSEFELTNNSLDNLEVRLIQGTAIVEATGADDTEMLINITTPHTKMAIVRRGLYRVKVVPGDVTELIVRKGRVLLADSQTKIKGGRKLVFSGLTFSEAKLEKADKESDDFDNWSKQRAETIAQVNRKIRSRDVNTLLASFRDPWWGASNGLWLFHPRFGCYTFLPFYYGWGSPYGNSYSSYFYYPNYYWSRRPYGSNTASYPRGSSGGSGSSSSGGNRSDPQPASPRQMPSAPPRVSSPEQSMPRAAEGKVLRSGDRMPH